MDLKVDLPIIQAIENKYKQKVKQFEFSQPIFNKKELTIKIKFSK